MKEHIRVNIDTAKLAKEKGFDLEIKGTIIEYLTDKKDSEHGYSGSFGWRKGEIEYDSGYIINNGTHDYTCENYTCYAHPTQSTLQAWLRDEHSYHIALDYGILCDKWSYHIYKIVGSSDVIEESEFQYEKYEDALEVGLQMVLKLL